MYRDDLIEKVRFGCRSLGGRVRWGLRCRFRRLSLRLPPFRHCSYDDVTIGLRKGFLRQVC